MGQQQLLLLALSAIIVGLAIVVGVNMFSEGAGKANQDAVTTDVLTIATRAQAWYRKPAQFGGGGRSFVGISWNVLQLDSTNVNGSYALSNITASTLDVTGTGTEDLNGDGTPLTVKVTVTPDSVRQAIITQ